MPKVVLENFTEHKDALLYTARKLLETYTVDPVLKKKRYKENIEELRRHINWIDNDWRRINHYSEEHVLADADGTEKDIPEGLQELDDSAYSIYLDKLGRIYGLLCHLVG